MNVTADITLAGRGTDDDGWERDEWDVTLHHDGRELFTKFYTGTLHGKPTMGEVIESLFSDALGVEYDGFEDWADNYGLNSDSRKDEATYNAIVDQTARLREFLGDDYYEDIEKTAYTEING